MVKKHIVVVGAGLSGLITANKLAENNSYRVTVLEKGVLNSPINDDRYYSGQSPNLNFTRAQGVGGTSNYWHSGLIKMPRSSSWAYNMLYTSGWYTQAMNLVDCQFPQAAKRDIQHNKFDRIYYPFKRYRAIPNQSVCVISSVMGIKIDTHNSNIGFSISGTGHCLDFDILILAAGGIGTPLLLQEEFHREQFQHSSIGANLTDHISSNPMKIKLKKLSLMRFSSFFYKGIIRKGHIYKDPKAGLNHIIYLRPAMNLSLGSHTQALKRLLIGFWATPNKIQSLLELASSVDMLLEIIANKLPIPLLTRYLSVSIVSEQESKNSNFVSCDGKKKNIVWSFSDTERKSVISACHWFISNSGLSIDSVSIADPQEIEFTGCCHHSGTASFGDDRSCNVVDKNLKVYGHDNIYICDGSVLPDTSYANTGLTLIALSLRLAEKIKLRLG